MRLHNTVKFTDKEDFIAKMKEALKAPDWKRTFCLNYENEIQTYERSDAQIRFSAGTGDGRLHVGEDEISDYLRDVLGTCIDTIANWLINGPYEARSFKLYVSTNVEGYAYDKELNRAPVDMMELAVRATVPERPFGFIVTGFSPVNSKLKEEFESALQ